MNWMVYDWWVDDGVFYECHEFEELEDAKAYAGRRADVHRKNDEDFDVRIYELTNY